MNLGRAPRICLRRTNVISVPCPTKFELALERVWERDSEFRGSAGEQYFHDDEVRSEAHGDEARSEAHSEACSEDMDDDTSFNGGIDAFVMEQIRAEERAAANAEHSKERATADAEHSRDIQVQMQAMQAQVDKQAREFEYTSAQMLVFDKYKQAAQQHEEESMHQKLFVQDSANKQNAQALACLPVPAAANSLVLLTAALRQFGGGNADRAEISELNNVGATVSVEFVLVTWAAEFHAAGMGEPDMPQIIRKTKAGGVSSAISANDRTVDARF